MDYGFIHNGAVFTPNQTQHITAEENEARNKAIQAEEIKHWASKPDVMLGYYDEKKGTITTWLGAVLGTITQHRIYRHNFGGRFITLSARGTNGADYYGRASYDWGSCIRLYRSKVGDK